MQSVHLILLSNGKWDSVHPKDTILTETVTPLKSTPLFIQPNNMLNDWWEKWESLPTFFAILQYILHPVYISYDHWTYSKGWYICNN